ncbi:Holliday junction branch migration DNA helicase RuvB [Candidatus Peregrinibacteria bacterium CG11_big_fil_rev_8_21_14_0_20_41_10]|nr:MAG: Holliday junction branch migration DNA helicase RuvB [Candidatus Peregrinibacteria bacterium CG11_big_fil_rev_8_21_14_0_20_41_10]PIZ73119.1 MAG: Holliday junction branch migration DNA helicase RuvB [Candidatus Peregrinibacteria bacterium CG_4_10_14_0_2_um_filter_41_8]PJC37686.1 MAG: Holliday junction branch migration DNA helicase RuvB [Candidatus Peregrinibacteria bacterium CG_4_9_14_0_2_um_filter_41_14]
MIKKGDVRPIKAKPVPVAKVLKSEQEDVPAILRPQTLQSYIGQTNVKEHVQLMIDAATQRKSVLDHILIHGGPGLGKTTLAGIVAREMSGQFKVTSGPAIEKQGDLAALLSSLEFGDILFIDEIHRLRPAVEEILYSAMEDYVLDLVVGKGPTAKSMRITIPDFTLIGATTKPNMLSSPLRDRFGSMIKLDYYSESEMEDIIVRSAEILGVKLDNEAAVLLASCCRRTPRIANRLLKRVRDFCLVKEIDFATRVDIESTLIILGIDNLGMNKLDRDLLDVVLNKFDGGPVGLKAISAAMQEDEDTLAEICEPYLMQVGFLQRTHRGRIVTDEGKKYLLVNPI